MEDITRVFEQWAQSNGIEYHYGQRANLNLLNSLENDKVYFLHNENRRRTNYAQMTGRRSGFSFSGNFFLVVQSDLDMPYYKEANDIRGENKYEKNIEPLLDLISNFEQHFACTDMSLTSLEIIDVTDLLDFNADGLLVTYGLSI